MTGAVGRTGRAASWITARALLPSTGEGGGGGGGGEETYFSHLSIRQVGIEVLIARLGIGRGKGLTALVGATLQSAMGSSWLDC
jgi:hypothetical protein